MADPWAKDWQELTSDEGTAAIVLGYDEGTWSVRDESSPDSCCKTWELLSEAQQRAASVLGYDQARWDAEYEGPQVSAEEELWTAAESSDPEAVSRALTRDPALDKLHGTAFCQQTVLHLSCGGGDLEVVKVLLEARAEVNATDDEGATPLHRVSFQGHFEVAKALLEAGADLEIRDKYGNSAEDKARAGGSDEVLALLEAVKPASAVQGEADSAVFDSAILSGYGNAIACGIVVSAALLTALWAVRRKG